ncbi:hypothetical protein LBMAG53_27700 [Planctomycetota bacterium]|nr:hypothetical protein LBMAG53_27700 [Planctomycetota bacterium]
MQCLMNRMWLGLLLILTVASTSGSTAAVEIAAIPPVAATSEAMIEVQLKSGVLWNGRPHNLVLMLSAEQGRWQRVRGYFLSVSVGDVHGYVVSAETSPTRASWDIVLFLPGDLYNKEALFGRFRVRAERSAPQAPWAATYEAQMMAQPVYRGAAIVTDLPLPPKRPGATPVAPGEHPRLLFRKSDLPELRKRLATPFGQAAKDIFEKGDTEWSGLCGWADSGDKKKFLGSDPASLGILYQLTGDKAYAERAKEPFMAELATENYGFLGIGQIWASRMLVLSIAWDCLREAWPDDFNRQVENVFINRCELLFFNSGGNSAATSNWAGPRNAGAGMASLVMAGDPGDPPPPLFSLQGASTRAGNRFSPLRLGIYRADLPLVTELPALPDASVPVWTPGKNLDGWIWPGLLTIELRGVQDLLAGMGGAAKAIPVEGATTTSTVFTAAEGPTDIALRFVKLPQDLAGKDGILADAVLGTKGSRTTVLSCLFKVASDLRVRCSPLAKGAVTWLDSAKLDPDQCYLLKAGTHRVLVYVSAKNDETVAGRLDPILLDAGADAVALEDSLRQFAGLERGDWEAKGRPDFLKDYLVDAGRSLHYKYCWLGMGEGGFHAETGHYSHDGGRGIYPYALMHWNVFGRLVSGRGDIARYVPRHVFSNPVGDPVPGHYSPKSRLQGLAISGINSPCAAAYAATLPFLEPAWRPAALWLWQQDERIDPAKPELAVKNDPLIAFFTYPLDLESRPPTSPIWPLTWSSPFRGWYGYRNGYSGTSKDALVQVFAKASNPMGWNHADTGTFAIQALGQGWAVSVDNREGYRFQESVVQIPSIVNHGGGYGVVRSSTTEPDGSGTLSIDLGNVYVPTENVPPLLDKNRMYIPGMTEPSGPITQGRFLAVDYSGKSGVPVVVVIVDRIDGLDGLQRHWQWMIPLHLRDGVTYTEHDFTANAGDATLRVTFAHPAKPEFKKPGEGSVTATTRKKEAKKDATEALDLKIEGSDGEVAGLGSTKKIKEAKKAAATEPHPLLGVGVVGSDHFFAVATIGAGAPPAVEVRGTGLDAVVVIGNRSYRFDGSRVVVGDKP